MQEFNDTHDLEPVYALMMDALDGPLSSDDQLRLDEALAADPALAAEWQGMLLIDDLFMETPLVDPPAHFAAQAIAALPNWRARRWAVALAFLASLSVGLLPVLLLGVALLIGVDFNIAATGLFEIVSAIFGGLGQLAFETTRMVAGYPAAMGAVMVMIGSITLWSGLYQQLVIRPVTVTN